MKSCEVVSLVTALSCEIVKIVSKEDIPLIAAILHQTASTIITITVNDNLLQSKNETPEPVTPSPDSEIIDL